MVRALPVLLLLLSAACGLAEDERDEKNRYIYLTFYDKAFEAYCLGEFDVDGDGRISRYEAQRVRTVECPERGVASLSDLKEFTRLERLDCRGNALTRLDVTMTRLEWLDCSDNGLVSLDVNGLRGLAYLDCGGNSLPRLDLQSNASLATLLCPDNALAGSLDVTSCASGLRADVRGNPSLATVYCLASQSVDFNGPTELIVKWNRTGTSGTFLLFVLDFLLALLDALQALFLFVRGGVILSGEFELFERRAVFPGIFVSGAGSCNSRLLSTLRCLVHNV